MMVDHSGNLRRWNAKYSSLYASWHVLFKGISTCNNFEESARAAWSEERIDKMTEISISRGTWFCEIISYLLNNRRSKFHKTACLDFCQSPCTVLYRVEFALVKFVDRSAPISRYCDVLPHLLYPLSKVRYLPHVSQIRLSHEEERNKVWLEGRVPGCVNPRTCTSSCCTGRQTGITLGARWAGEVSRIRAISFEVCHGDFL